jgi:predicted ATPase
LRPRRAGWAILPLLPHRSSGVRASWPCWSATWPAGDRPCWCWPGEPGIGKTSLLREAVQRAPGQGWHVLEGGCQRRGGQEPYAPLLQALERHLRQRAPAQVRTDLRGCAWLVRLLPELAAAPIEPLPAWTLAPEQERRLMVGAVARFLGNVAGSAGTLFLLDDLQWAGNDALDLLATLVRSTEAPLRVVGAYRDTEVQPHDPHRSRRRRVFIPPCGRRGSSRSCIAS